MLSATRLFHSNIFLSSDLARASASSHCFGNPFQSPGVGTIFHLDIDQTQHPSASLASFSSIHFSSCPRSSRTTGWTVSISCKILHQCFKEFPDFQTCTSHMINGYPRMDSSQVCSSCQPSGQLGQACGCLSLFLIVPATVTIFQVSWVQNLGNNGI